MKKLVALSFCLLVLISLSSCSNINGNLELKPDLVSVRDICKLSTLECYYHNVAKLEKDGDSYLFGSAERSARKIWFEYTGIVTIGVDFSKVNMSIDGYTVTVYMPNAECFDTKVKENTLTTDKFYISKDNSDFWMSNHIDSDEQVAAIAEAQKNMREQVMNNESLLRSARQRAMELIENYITNLGDVCGVSYSVVFVDTEE